MKYLEDPIFEDPALKLALARAIPSFKTPEHLRDRIILALKTGDATPMPPVPMREIHTPHTVANSYGQMRIHPQTMAANGWSTLLPGMAIAASMLISIGLMAFFLSGSAQAMPKTFEAAAIARHDECCGAPDHHLPVIRNATYPEIGRFLRQELHRPVLAVDLTSDGWTFSGAAICPIAGVRTGHLLFRKGSETLSIFSLPASALPTLAQHQSYQGTTADGHALIVRAENGALYCLVGHAGNSELTVDQLDDIFDRHSAEATVAEATGSRISVAGISREQ